MSDWRGKIKTRNLKSEDDGYFPTKVYYSTVSIKYIVWNQDRQSINVNIKGKPGKVKW